MKLSFIHLYPFKTDQPPISFAYIATYIRKYGEYTNVNIIESTFEHALENIKKEKPDVIGFSAHSIFYPLIIKLAKEIRHVKSLKDSIIILGGPHISSLPKSFDPIFDIGVVGEGEQTMLELMNLLNDKGKIVKGDLKKIKGLVYFHNGEFIQTPFREMIQPLDKIPMLDWSMIDKSYFKKNQIFTSKPTVVASIITSRGCPYLCLFCNACVLWGRKVRFHSAKRVADEIELLHQKYNATFIHVLDDLFTINKNRLKELINELRQRELLGKLEFICMGRTNTVDEELMSLLKQLNVTKLNFGFESGSNRMIQYLKGQSVSIKTHKKAVKLCKKYGIKPRGSFIFGSPTETLEDMKKTLKFMDFLKKNGAEIIWSQVMTPFPGTPIWETAKSRGKVSDDMDWEKLSFFNPDEPLLLDKDVDINEFRKIFGKARSKTRYYELKIFTNRLAHSPIPTIVYLLSNLRFTRFFLTKKKT